MVPVFEIDTPLLEAYSRGEITRREIEAHTGSSVSFGVLLGQLHAHDLPLPRFPSDPKAPGFELVRRLAERAPKRHSGSTRPRRFTAVLSKLAAWRASAKLYGTSTSARRPR